MPRKKSSKNERRVRFTALDVDAALRALIETGPAPAEPVAAQRKADAKKRPTAGKPGRFS